MPEGITSRLEDARAAVASVPRIIPILLIPSWASWLLMDREDGDLDHLLYFYAPDMIERPWRLIPNVTVTPLVNTQNDQVVLVSVLIVVFGGLVERRLGLWRALAVFWATSSAAALLGGALFHLLEPWFGDFEVVASVRERVYNGASAGGYGLMGAFAATTKHLRWWAAVFVVWEPAFWFVIAQALEFTPTFHVIAFLTGVLLVRTVFFARLQQHRQERAREERGPATAAG